MERNHYNPFEIIMNDLKIIKDEVAGIKSALASASVPEKKYYTIAETAKKLNVATITIYRNCQMGKIPNKKIGSRLLIPGSFVDK